MYTERLYLCPFLDGISLEEIFSGYGDPSVNRYLGFRIKELEEAQKQIEYVQDIENNDLGRWYAIRDKNTKEFYGAFGWKKEEADGQDAEIAYWLIEKAWGHEYILEVFHALLPTIANHGVHKLLALTDPENSNSLRVLEKLQFTYEKTETNTYKDGIPVQDMVFYYEVGQASNEAANEMSA